MNPLHCVLANLQPTTSGTPNQVAGDSRLRGGKAPDVDCEPCSVPDHVPLTA